MSHGTNEMGQGEGTLSRAAGLVAEARADFDRLSGQLEGRILGLQGSWTGAGGQAFFSLHQAWTGQQRVVVSALDGFAAALTATEKDNVSTDQAQSAVYRRTAGRLGG